MVPDHVLVLSVSRPRSQVIQPIGTFFQSMLPSRSKRAGWFPPTGCATNLSGTDAICHDVSCSGELAR
jgi:hypothetical protein